MRADRLLSMMLLLNARGSQTAQQLATELEVSERTIYRDIEALSMAGVPIYTQSGTNGGIFLDEHYRVSLTGLSKTEVLSLFAATETEGNPLQDLGMGHAITDGLLKLFAALPNMHRQEVEAMRQRILIDPTRWFQITEPLPYMNLLQLAVWEDRRIQVQYQAVEGQADRRQLDAIALVAKSNVWYLVGRKPDGEYRNYRAVRLANVELLPERFVRDADFDLASYWKSTCETFERESMVHNPPYETRLLVHHNAFWYFPGFMEGRYQALEEADSDGWQRMRVVFTNHGEARTTVLGLGRWVRVLQPHTLRASVLQQARDVLAFYDESL